MNTCRDCRHWRPKVTDESQGCVSPKMDYGYGPKSHEPDHVHIENDEGWGMIPGPEFGCIHFEEKL